jgi:hypothetical protein
MNKALITNNFILFGIFDLFFAIFIIIFLAKLARVPFLDTTAMKFQAACFSF